MGFVERGSNVTFEFDPSDNYEVRSIIVDGVELSKSQISGAIAWGYELENIESHHTIHVVFALIQYNVIINQSDHGTIYPQGNQKVNIGSDLLIVIQPEQKYILSSLLVNGQEVINKVVDNKYRILDIKQNYVITAVFDIMKFTIEVVDCINGSISPSGTIKVAYGGSQTFNFQADEGYRVKNVKVNNENKGASSSYTFNNVTENYVLEVEFERLSYTIRINSGANGHVLINGDSTVLHGDSRTIDLIASTGYYVSYIQVNNERWKNTNQIVLENIRQDYIIQVGFANQFYIKTEILTGKNMGTITDSKYVKFGDNHRIDITANEGYQIKSVSVDGEIVGTSNYYVFNNVDYSHNIAVEFEKIQYNIVINSSGQGKINTNDTTFVVDYGGSLSFETIPDRHWYVYKVIINEQEIPVTSSKIDLVDIHDNMEIYIIFAERQNKFMGVDVSKVAIVAVFAVLMLFVVVIVIKIHKSQRKL